MQQVGAVAGGVAGLLLGGQHPWEPEERVQRLADGVRDVAAGARAVDGGVEPLDERGEDGRAGKGRGRHGDAPPGGVSSGPGGVRDRRRLPMSGGGSPTPAAATGTGAGPGGRRYGRSGASTTVIRTRLLPLPFD